MADVFLYFVAIGSGLSFGIAMVGFASLAIYKRMNKDEGGRRKGAL